MERHRPSLEHLSAQGASSPLLRRLQWKPRPRTTWRVSGAREALRRVRCRSVITAVGHSIGGWAALCPPAPRPEDAILPLTSRGVPGRPVVLYAAAGWLLHSAPRTGQPPMLVSPGADAVVPVDRSGCWNSRGRQRPGSLPGDHFGFMNGRPGGGSGEFDRETFRDSSPRTPWTSSSNLIPTRRVPDRDRPGRSDRLSPGVGGLTRRVECRGFPRSAR